MELQVIKDAGQTIVIASKSKKQTNQILKLYKMKKDYTKTITYVFLTSIASVLAGIMLGHILIMLITFFK